MTVDLCDMMKMYFPMNFESHTYMVCVMCIYSFLILDSILYSYNYPIKQAVESCRELSKVKSLTALNIISTSVIIIMLYIYFSQCYLHKR